MNGKSLIFSVINPFITNPFYSRGTVSVGCGPIPIIEVIFFGRQYPNPTIVGILETWKNNPVPVDPVPGINPTRKNLGMKGLKTCSWLLPWLDGRRDQTSQFKLFNH